MLLTEIAETSTRVAATSARLGKIDHLASCLRRLEPHEVDAAVAFLSGELRQRQIGVGYATLREVPRPAVSPSLTVTAVDSAFEEIGRQAGTGSLGERRRLLTELFDRATAPEQRFLVRLLTGELRQGALDGVMVEAIARAAEVAGAQVRRALMLSGSLGAVATAALAEGTAGLAAFRLRIGNPLRPMLAQSAESVDAALARISPPAVEWKLDGIRVQVHRLEDTGGGSKGQGGGKDAVRVFTRTLDDITSRVPEVVEATMTLPVRTVVLDGEVIALRPDGRPQPFQATAARTGSRLEVETLRAATPLTLFLFDVLHLDGEDLIDRPGAERGDALARIAPPSLRMPRTVTSDPGDAAEVLRGALEQGHEGVVVKSLDAPYEAGRRGSGWIKVKPRHTLDLVVLAAEWGHGRRRGWLSNLHLGARDAEGGGFVMLGKTFKGLTDQMLRWQTEKFQELKVSQDSWVVHVRPELVVEIAFDGVQRSPRYPAGLALRFARVLRYRPDKRPDEADTIEAVQAIYAAGLGSA
ncbi:MAG: ATP-dependent DNA ligase [Streptosporangiales bacterium]|nr:ATP-dependent DNA ligase [Streptosporangiales bacterium]